MYRDSELFGIILKKPFRFDRPAYLKAKAEAIKQDETKKVDLKIYWRPIPSQHLYFFADKISNINLTYLTASGERTNPDSLQKYLEEARPFKDVGKLTVEVPNWLPEKKP